MTDPDNLVGTLFDCCFRAKPLPSLVRDWLIRGILASARRDQPLDESLGLSGPGRSTLQKRLQMVKRDAHLVQAFQSIAIDDRVSDWSRCTRLASEARRFSEFVWPQARRLAEPSPDWPAFKKSLWLASATDLPLPRSATRIRAIVLQNTGFSQNQAGAKILSRFI